jgi:tetratricopeptide (TPR) repeat protein
VSPRDEEPTHEHRRQDLSLHHPPPAHQALDQERERDARQQGAGPGDVQRAIGYYEQALAIQREIGDAMGVATDSFNMALLYTQRGQVVRALPLAQQAAQILGKIGSPNVQVAQQLVAELQGKSR